VKWDPCGLMGSYSPVFMHVSMPQIISGRHGKDFEATDTHSIRRSTT